MILIWYLVRLARGDSSGIEDAVEDNAADAIREHCTVLFQPELLYTE